jgi:hypothetical protein
MVIRSFKEYLAFVANVHKKLHTRLFEIFLTLNKYLSLPIIGLGGVAARERGVFRRPTVGIGLMEPA